MRRRSGARPMEAASTSTGTPHAGALIEAPAQPVHDDDLLARLSVSIDGVGSRR